MASKKEISYLAAKWWSDLIVAGAEFENILANEIQLYLEPKPWDENSPQTGEALRVIYVEYSPNTILTDAATQAGISINRFPWKTVMWLSPNGIKVRVGEGGQLQEIAITNPMPPAPTVLP